MATREELEQLRLLLENQGMERTTLTPEINLQANVINAAGGMEGVSSAGTVQRVPIFPMGSQTPQTPTQLPQAPTVPQPVAGQESSGFFGRIGSAIQSFNSYLTQPANREMLGQMAVALSGQYQDSVGAQLGRVGIQRAQDESEQALMDRAMQGEDPLTYTGVDAGAANPEMRRRVEEDFQRLRAEGREGEAHEASLRNVDSVITAREAATYNDEERLYLERIKVGLQMEQFDFAVSESKWKQQLEERKIELAEQAARIDNNLTRARTEFQQMQTRALEQGRPISGGSRVGGSPDDLLNFQRISNVLRTELQNYNVMAGQLMAAEATISGFEGIRRPSEPQRRAYEAALITQETLRPMVAEQNQKISDILTLSSQLYSPEGFNQEVDDQSILGSDSNVAGGEQSSGSGQATLSLIQALEANDADAIRQAAAAALTAGEISKEAFSRAVSKAMELENASR